jgi:hypothetical protein
LVFTGERLAFTVPAFAVVNVVLTALWLSVVVLLNGSITRKQQIPAAATRETAAETA